MQFAPAFGHEQISYFNDETCGYHAIIAIHSTALGPSLGGTRMRPYSSADEARDDVMRLSRAMTYKAATAGLDLGGGKAVILGDPAKDKSPELLAAHGRAIESLGGRYVTACDVGTTPEDMVEVGKHTRWATGAPRSAGGSGDSGELTAWGVFQSMKATASEAFGSDDLSGRSVAVQGLGKVGRRLVAHLVGEGATVTVTDISDDAVAAAVSDHGVTAVAPDEIMTVDVDIFSPNALGGVLTEDSIALLKAKAVCGGANNQLATPDDAKRLDKAGILYAPDYVVNAGGLVSVSDELGEGGFNEARARETAERIGANVARVFALAKEHGVDTATAADRVAEDRIRAAVGERSWFRG